MRRRNFVLAAGSGILTGSLGISQAHRPAVGLDFEIVDPAEKDPNNVDRLVLNFNKLDITPQCLDDTEPMLVEAEANVDNHDQTGSSDYKVSLTNGKTEQLSGKVDPIVVDGIDTDNNIFGTVTVTLSHPDIEDSYRRQFIITDGNSTYIDTFNDGNIDGWSTSNVQGIQFPNSYNESRCVEINTVGGDYPGSSYISSTTQIPSSFSNGDILEWYWKWDYDGKIRMILADSSGNQQLRAQVRPNSIDQDHDLTTSEIRNRTGGQADANTWYRNQIELSSSTVKWTMWDLNNNKMWSETASNDTLSDFDEMQLSCARNYNMDWVQFDDVRVL